MSSVAFSPDNRLLISEEAPAVGEASNNSPDDESAAYLAKQLAIRNLEDETNLRRFSLSLIENSQVPGFDSSMIRAIGISRDHSRVAVVRPVMLRGKTRVDLIDISGTKRQYEIDSANPFVEAYALDCDLDYLAGFLPADGVRIFKLESGQFDKTIATECRQVRQVGFSDDSRQIFVANGQELKIYNLNTGTLHFRLIGHEQAISAFCQSSTHRLIATGDLGGHVLVWNADSGKLQKRLEPMREPVLCLAFSPTAERLAGGGGAPDSAGLIDVWEIGLGLRAIRLQGHIDPVEYLAFSPDGTNLYSVSPRTLRVWRALAE
jgi:WD40 repeat protein